MVQASECLYPLTALVDFTLSNARRSYSSMGNPLDGKGLKEQKRIFAQERLSVIHLIPKWQPTNYSFVCMLIGLLRLVKMYEKQKNFEVKMRRGGLINMQTRE